MIAKRCQNGQITPLIPRITSDWVDSPADVNPKGTPRTAERKKRTSVYAAKAYGNRSVILVSALSFTLLRWNFKYLHEVFLCGLIHFQCNLGRTDICAENLHILILKNLLRTSWKKELGRGGWTSKSPRNTHFWQCSTPTNQNTTHKISSLIEEKEKRLTRRKCGWGVIKGKLFPFCHMIIWVFLHFENWEVCMRFCSHPTAF